MPKKKISADEARAILGGRPIKEAGESIASYNQRLGKFERRFNNLTSGFTAKERAAAANTPGLTPEQQQYVWWNGPNAEDTPGYQPAQPPATPTPPVNTDRPDLPQPGQSTTITSLTDRAARSNPAPTPVVSPANPAPDPVPMTRPRPTLSAGSMGVAPLTPTAPLPQQRRFGAISSMQPQRLRYR